MKKMAFHLLLFIMIVSPLAAPDDKPIIEDIILKNANIVGTTATINFDNFDVSSTGRMDLKGGLNLSGGTAGAANILDLGSGANDDLTATDVTDLTDGGTTTLHSHAAQTTLDDMYNNDVVGDAQITVDARDISFDLNDNVNDFLISIDNTTTGIITTAFEIVTSGAGGTITTAMNLADAGFANALNLGANQITGTNYSLITTVNNSITLQPNGTGDVIINGADFAVDATGTMTNVTAIQGDAGDQSTPAFSFSADNSVGLYRSAADDLRFLDAGSEEGEMRIFDTTGTASDGIYMGLFGSSDNGVCHANAGTGTQEQIVDCSGTPSDIAEWYETTSDIEPGDIVATSENLIEYQGVRLNERNAVFPGEMAKVSILKKSTKPYQENLMGVISTAPYQVFGEDIKDAASSKHPLPLALVGRVPVKVSRENGAISIGDPITSSSKPGVGMKATNAGPIVGVALEPYNGKGVSKIMMVVMNKTSYFPRKTQKLVQTLSENAHFLREIIKSEALMHLIKDKTSLKTVRTLIQLYQGSPDKEAISSIKNIPSSVFNKLAYISQQLIRRNLGTLADISDEELMRLLKKEFVIDETLIVKGEIIQTLKTKNDGERLSYVQTSTEPYLVTRGEAVLQNGVTTIKLDPQFLEVVQISKSHPMLVQLTPKSVDLQGPLVVVERTSLSFTVQEANGGDSQSSFVWEVSAPTL